MKKEIIFRGRDENGKWVYGNLYNTSNNESYIMPSSTLYTTKSDGDEMKCLYVAHRIKDTDTIGQYIGIKDKYENKIFEGDYIKDVNTPNHGLYLVSEMNKEQQLYYIDTRDGWASKAVINFSNLDLESIEIVGGIYDKPILEVKIIKTEL